MNITKAYNFINIDENVSSSGTMMNTNLKSLADAKYDAVINLLPDDNEHAKKEERESFEALNIDYTYIPVDWDAPTQTDFDVFEKVLIAAKNKKIHIHCAANYRATAFYALYAYKNLGWSRGKIDTFTASIWQISDYPVWLKFIDDRTNDA